MRRLAAIAASCLLFSASASAQAQAQAPEPTKKAAKKKPAKPGTPAAAQPSDAAAPAGAAATGEKQGAASGTAAGPGTAAAPGPAASKGAAAAGNPALPQPVGPGIDPEEFRRQVMEEVRRELQKTRDEVKQETAWVAQDSQARVQDSEAVEQLRQRVNLFQPHGYLRLRPEFLYGLDLGRGPDPTGHTLFPVPFIGAPASGPGGSNHSISQANMRFRFEPTLEVSEDLAIYSQIDILDNVLLGSDPTLDPYLDPFTPLSVLTHGRAASAVRVKRVWGRVNTQLGELVFGRMGYHWGLGILHNDGNCLDCDFGDTYDRVAFSPRDFRGHKFTLMMDLLSKGQGTTGEYGELGRSVDLDTLDDGYRLAIEVVRLDTAEEAKRKLDAGRWVVNYGLVADYRVQAWDTITLNALSPNPTLGGFVGDRNAVVQRKAKIYQPDVFLSLRKGKFRLDAELATQIGNVGTRAVIDSASLTSRSDVANPAANQALTFFGVGFALQTDYALLPANSLLIGLELGGASADRGIYGFGARPWRNGSGGRTKASPRWPTARKSAPPGGATSTDRASTSATRTTRTATSTPSCSTARTRSTRSSFATSSARSPAPGTSSPRSATAPPVERAAAARTRASSCSSRPCMPPPGTRRRRRACRSRWGSRPTSASPTTPPTDSTWVSPTACSCRSAASRTWGR
jgi:uncharacterized protein (TIGR04551 family)